MLEGLEEEAEGDNLVAGLTRVAKETAMQHVTTLGGQLVVFEGLLRSRSE